MLRPTTLLIATTLAACSPSSPAGGPSEAATSSVPASRLMPLPDGHLYHYVTEGTEGPGTFVVRVRAAGRGAADLAMPSETKRVEHRPDGVAVRSPSGEGYLLKAPLTVGATWRGEHGGVVTLRAVDAHVDVPAGAFDGCVRLVERRGGDRPLMVTTTLCPDVGIVELTVSSGMEEQRATLRSHGPPIDLGPDGVRVLE